MSAFEFDPPDEDVLVEASDYLDGTFSIIHYILLLFSAVIIYFMCSCAYKAAPIELNVEPKEESPKQKADSKLPKPEVIGLETNEPSVEADSPKRLPTSSSPRHAAHFSGPPPVKTLEEYAAYFKSIWNGSSCPQELHDIVARVIRDRAVGGGAPISNVVCLGIGFETNYKIDLQQFVVLSEIIDQLAVANPKIRKNIVFQDPCMQLNAKKFYAKHGKIVEHPAAFKLIGPNTFIFSPWVGQDKFVETLKPDVRGNIEFGLFVGNGCDLSFTDSLKRYTPGYGVVEKNITCRLFDPVMCEARSLPCYTSRDGTKREYAVMGGLERLDIWWKPLELGFPDTYEIFKKAFKAEYHKLHHIQKRMVIYMYLANRYKEVAQAEDFLTYMRKSFTLERYADFIKDRVILRYLSIVRDSKQRQRTWIQYMNGDTDITLSPVAMSGYTTAEEAAEAVDAWRSRIDDAVLELLPEPLPSVIDSAATTPESARAWMASIDESGLASPPSPERSPVVYAAAEHTELYSTGWKWRKDGKGFDGI